jgi:hypothetical protein
MANFIKQLYNKKYKRSNKQRQEKSNTGVIQRNTNTPRLIQTGEEKVPKPKQENNETNTNPHKKSHT